ncbi:putative Rho-type GTPase-activating protein 2 [Metarhizium anisopliae]
MGRRPTPQPLPLGSTKANTSANSIRSTYNRGHRLGATGATAAAATGFGLGATAQATRTGTAACIESTAETAAQTANVSPIHPRPPVSLQPSLPLSLQSQPSQHSLQSELSQSQSHSRSQPSVSLTSRFAATKRPQTSQSSQTGRGHMPTLGHETSQPRPPQLQLQHEQSPPYHDQISGSASLAFRQVSSDAEKRPSTKSGFFHFNKSSKSSNQLPQNPCPQLSDSQEYLATRGPEEPRAPKSENFPYTQEYLQKPPLPSRSELSLSSAGDCDGTSAHSPGGKRSKTKSFGLLSRTRSHRDKDRNNNLKAAPVLAPATLGRNENYDNAMPLRTAPVAQDRAFRDMMNSSARNRSEDRAARRDSSRDKEKGALPSSLKENGSGFFSGLRTSSTRAADIISKGLFGKSSRSGSTTEREHVVDDEHYILKVLNLPLVEQTRITRIAKRLETSKDKTEFWMPAFPWRAIDYLNHKGCDVEGLYRVPGSGPQIKKWQRKFDERYDVDLFKDDDLYDINIIGSMLKAWLRELPDELFPKAAQDRIARECSGATKVPQLLVEELSNLSPFNYYLLFAITCHLSLLLSRSDKNKMDFRNLALQRQFSGSNASIGSRISTISTNVTTNSEREPQETTRQLRPLSPIKPLSPIGF